MTITVLGLFRAICLVFAVSALLAGTILFPLVRRVVQAWLRMGKRLAGPRASPPPALLTQALASDVILRGWQLMCAAIALAFWWYLGTAHGAAVVTATLRPH